MTEDKNPHVEKLMDYILAHEDVKTGGYDSSDPETLVFWVEPKPEVVERIDKWFEERAEKLTFDQVHRCE